MTSIITAKYPSYCPTCRQPIVAGTRVIWERGQKASHVECPQGALLAQRILDQAPAAQASNVRALCQAISAQAKGQNYAILVEALDCLEDQYTLDYERQAPRATAVPPSETGARRLAALATLPKGIYRVSLDGTERRYGVTHVNVNLVPGRDGTVKVGEWQGARVGRVGADGEVFYWRESREWGLPAVDPNHPRVKAVVAALDVILGAADPLDFAKAYAVESSTCWRCGADLVDEKSRERLLGPDCYRLVKKGA